VAKSEREMKEMMKNLGKYVRKKKVEVKLEKRKMVVFNKRKRKSEENEWNWEGRKIEEINEFQYLGYTFNERATGKEIVRKANKVVRGIWGIGERKWKGDFRRGMMIFESIIENILMYGTETSRWKEKEEIEKVKENI
jgi:hypothetical protein